MEPRIEYGKVAPGALRAMYGAEDDLYDEVREHFSEKELVDLTTAIIAVNGWNRLAIAFRTEVGSYQPKGRER